VVTIDNQWYHTGKHGERMDPAMSKPHEALARWQAAHSH
jgi:hypothetical protein